ncbi:hypothetical protein SH668x_000202 [Planctomicrobium sp. SH668]|uniref:hypothetical protein n=1 Tax=Planctomicrobium sp. SH668 TaxID=3448126 RepID=UPI003F5C4E91
MHEFHCPHCAIPLRFRDDSLRNRVIDCPDCHRPLLIQQDTQGLRGVIPESLPSLAKSSLPLPATKSRLPVIIFAVATCVVGLLIAISLNRPEIPVDVEKPKADAPSLVVAPVVLPEQPKVEAQTPEPPVQQGPVEPKLREIYRLLRTELGTGTVARNPADELTLSQRSWIARIADRELAAAFTNWNQSWNAPVNDEFVRRRFPAFQNPQIAHQTGADLYPASHFVGVSGVGADAETLPKNHPRAGVFRGQQITKQEDITDGLTNTMLVAGVESRLGSWAAPGEATVRSFTAEPYVHGPDGFGTGDSDSMLVLMADGSVRRLSSKTDAVVVRRMASMADGLPLEAQVADKPESEAEEPVAETPDQAVIVIQTMLADPDAEKIDLKLRLEQKIAAYEQDQPVPLISLLLELQELIGVPVTFQTLTEEQLDSTVALQLKDVSVQGILDAICQASNTTYKLHSGHIELQSASDKVE